jgi:hypothetical protein
MRRIHSLPRWLVLSLAMAWIGLTSVPATTQTVLQWKFKAGKKLHYQTKEKMQMVTAVGGQKINTDINKIVDTLWEVKSVDAEGVATIEKKTTRAQFHFKNFMFDSTWDSRDGKEPQGLLAGMIKPLQDLLARPSTLKMNPFGKILEGKPAKETAGEKKEPTGSNSQDSGLNDGSSDTVADQSITFPEKGLVEGQPWKQTATQEMDMGKTRTESTYVFLGMETKGERSLAKIAIASKIQIELSEESPGEMEVTDAGGKGICWFDPQRGVIVLTETTTNITMVGTAMGQSMEQKITQHNVMTLLEEQAGKDKADKTEGVATPKEKTAKPPAPIK